MVRKRRLFEPGSNTLFPLSRSKLDLYMNCPRCFYLDRRLGVGRPSGPPFTLNSAVDQLLKSEFDEYRARGEPHPLLLDAGIAAVPARHPDLDVWRQNFKGVRVPHPDSGFEVFGAIDDLWIDTDTREFIVADYKATAKDAEVSLDADWQIAYKRQMEVYQWLLAGTGLRVSKRSWFGYCNGMKSEPRFDSTLRFKIKLIPYDGDTEWVEPKLIEARRCLEADTAPAPALTCEWCRYIGDAASVSSTYDCRTTGP